MIELINRDARRLAGQPPGFLQPRIVYPSTAANVYRYIKSVQKLLSRGKGQLWSLFHLDLYCKALVDRIYFARNLFNIQPRFIESVKIFLYPKFASGFENLSRFNNRNP